MDIKLKPVDAVVVGMGVAGTIIAKELAGVGMQVVGFERGRMIETRHDFAMPFAHDELRFDPHRADILQNLSRETLTFRNAVNERALPMRQMGSFRLGEVVGGAAAHWGAAAPRYLPWDFEVRSRAEERYGKGIFPEDCTSQDWGVTFEELEPFFDQFECIYGVGGRAGNINGEIQPGGNPFEGPRYREFPNPPAIPSYATTLFAEAASSLGYTPFPLATCGMTQAYTNSYRQTLGQCARGGFCSGHGCTMDAKASPLSTTVPALLKHSNFEMRTLCNVIRVNMDSDGRKATGVTYIDSHGREVEQPAELVVLAAYSFNNTRLMLLSGIGKPYDPLSNTGVVGKNYSYQTTAHTRYFFDDRILNTFMGGAGVGTSIDEYNGDNFDHAGLGFIGGALIDCITIGSLPIRVRPVPDGTPAWGSEWKQAVAKYYNANMGIGAHGGCQSYRTNYLDLDPTYKDAYGLPLLRMTFDWHDNEKKLSAYVTKKAAEIGQVLKPAHLSAHAKHGHYNIVPYQSTHNMGGCIMGVDPATSVVNKYLQSWNAHNVFVVGGSAFPQNGANNPTCTIGTMACWAADAIKEQYRHKNGPLM